jgi:hypothetical protein
MANPFGESVPNNQSYAACGRDADCLNILKQQDLQGMEDALAARMLGNLLGIPGQAHEKWLPQPYGAPNATAPNGGYVDQSGREGYYRSGRTAPYGSQAGLEISANDPAEKLLSAAQVAMYSPTDPAQGMQVADGKYQAAVNLATQELTTAQDHDRSVHVNLGKQAWQEQNALSAAEQSYRAAFAGVKPEEQDTALKTIELFAQKLKADPNYNGELALDLERWHLLEPVKAVLRAQDQPATKAITEADRSAAAAMAIVLDTRTKYGDALQTAGMDDKAWEQRKAAVELTGRHLPDHRPESATPPGTIKG